MAARRIVTSSSEDPGIVRVRRGRGFSYATADGARVTDIETLDRIAALAIPPAWTQVWICSDPRGHLQAVGLDAEGRRQYRYHDAFTERRAAAKWRRVEEFGRGISALRDDVLRLTSNPSEGSLDREHAVAWCVRMLDRSLLRVGSVEYERRNGTYGLCTLKRRHVNIADGVITLQFVGKHAIRHVVSIVDDTLARDLELMLEGRGRDAPFLGWRDGRRWRPVPASAVNAYINSLVPDATAKDFRSWHGSVLAAASLVFEHRVDPDASRRTIAVRALSQVADVLGNTPAVTRAAYVHPAVLDAWADGRDIGPAIEAAERFDDLTRTDLRDVAERALLDLLDGRVTRTMREHARDALLQRAS